MIFAYFGIPIGIIVWAFFRAEKGKRSVVMLTITFGLQVAFNMIAILNSPGNQGILAMGSILTLMQIICYFVIAYITNKNAEKAKQKKIKNTEEMKQ